MYLYFINLFHFLLHARRQRDDYSFHLPFSASVEYLIHFIYFHCGPWALELDDGPSGPFHGLPPFRPEASKAGPRPGPRSGPGPHQGPHSGICPEKPAKKSGQISRGFCARRNGSGPGSRLAHRTKLGSGPLRLGRHGLKGEESNGSFISFISFYLLPPSSALFYAFYLFSCGE